MSPTRSIPGRASPRSRHGVIDGYCKRRAAGHRSSEPKNLGVDVIPLHMEFYEAKSRIKDLYLPDDTRLSTAGYRELAAHVARQESRVTHSQLPSRAEK